MPPIWEKISDNEYTKSKSWSTTYSRQFSYNRLISYIYNAASFNYPSITLLFETISQNNFLACHHNNQELFHRCFNENYKSTKFENVNDFISAKKEYVIWCDPKQGDDARQFIDIIDQFYPLGWLKAELYPLLGIRENENEIANEISELVENGNFDPAIALAKKWQSESYHEVMWALVNRLHEDNLVNEKKLIDLYQSIPSKSPYYRDANERLIILCSKENFPGHEETPFYYLEKQLDLAVKAENNRLTSQIFHTLSDNTGLKMNDQTSNLADILIEAAATQRELKNENRRLKQENDTLKLNKNNLTQTYRPKFF